MQWTFTRPNHRGPTSFGKVLNYSFLSFLRKKCVASITQRFLVPVSTVSARNAWHNDPHLWIKYDENPQGVLPEKLGGVVRHVSWNPLPISDQNLWFSLPYFRPEALEPGAWPERVTSCYGTYTVVGVNIKREMVLSPNDEEVANSSKKTRVHKPYPERFFFLAG